MALVTLTIAQQALERGGAGFVIQRRHALKRSELGTVFTIQAVLGGLISVALWIGALVLGAHAEQPRLTLLVQAAAAASMMYALRAVPLGSLERSLSYGRVATVEVIDILAFNLIAVAGVQLGLGLPALAIGLVGRAAASFVATVLLSRVGVTFQFDRSVVAEFFKFGLPYATSNGLSFINTAAAPIIVGGFVGLSEFGVLQLAYTLISYPQTLTTILSRVGFATYSRMRRQDMKDTVSRSTSNLIRVAGGATLLLGASSAVWVQPLFGPAWTAMPAYMLVVAPAYGLGANLNLVIASINASGHASAVLAVSALFSSIFWLTSFVLVPALGGLGLPIAYSLATVVYCGYLAVAKALLGGLQLRSPLVEYGAMCFLILVVVILTALGGVSPNIFLVSAAVIAAWVGLSLDLRSIRRLVMEPLSR